MIIDILKLSFFILFLSCMNFSGSTQHVHSSGLRLVEQDSILTGARQTDLYFPLLYGKSAGIVCNHTSLIGRVHLVDTMLASGIALKTILSPEHGFRGEAAAGDHIDDKTDQRTGLPVISLYGNKQKPAPEDLTGIDVIIFDIQDVGVRFYTYISTLSLVMEACAEQGIPLIVLDRPNPNGFYIDGPVLDTSLRSFVGMHPVPVVYGMTIGEYARMVNGEGWLANQVRCDLTVVPLAGWDRKMIVKLPVRPSPNLPTWQSVYLYPSICLFEGTTVSVGRGTNRPFQAIGHPGVNSGSLSFTPADIEGIAKDPPYEGQTCYGQDVTGFAENFLFNDHPFTLSFLISYYYELKSQGEFFNNYFDKLTGDRDVRESILEGKAEISIRNGWDEALKSFYPVRKKYLLYPDFY